MTAATLDLARPIPLIEDIARREFLSGAAAALLLAACGSETESGSATTTAMAGPRTVSHLRGTTEVTGRPLRVVILDNGPLGHLIPLGVKPVGTAGEDEAASMATPYEALVDYDTLPLVAPNLAPTFAAIAAAARPDLILAINYGEDADYQRLGQVAPTVVVASDFDPERRPGIGWVRDTMRTIALALGRPDDAKAPIEAHESELADLERRHAGRIEDNPLFQGLPAVREGRSFTVDSDLWFSRSIVGAGLLLEDLDGIVAKLPGK